MKKGLDVVKIRLVKEDCLYENDFVTSKSDAVEVMKKELADYDREVFCILNLKTRGEVINMNIVSQGTWNASIVSPREVFKSSILSNAAGIIALHNHPSGNIKPSREDYETTKRLKECGDLLDIPLIDHVIVAAGGRKVYSFKEHDELDIGEKGYVKEPEIDYDEEMEI